MSAIRNLAMEPDRDLRHRAWQAELGAWEAHALRRGRAQRSQRSVLTLAARRNWADPLDESLFWSAIDREVLDVMVEEARAAARVPALSPAEGKAARDHDLGWYDLLAPVGVRGERGRGRKQLHSSKSSAPMAIG